MAERISAETLMNDLVALRNLRAAARRAPEDEKASAYVRELEDLLRAELFAWGGLEALELWLAECRPGFMRPSTIEEMDWSWLQRTSDEAAS